MLGWLLTVALMFLFLLFVIGSKRDATCTEVNVLFPGTIQIEVSRSGRYRFVAADYHPAPAALWEGDWQGNREAALRDAALWLESRGWIHPLTHDMEAADGAR